MRDHEGRQKEWEMDSGKTKEAGEKAGRNGGKEKDKNERIGRWSALRVIATSNNRGNCNVSKATDYSSHASVSGVHAPRVTVVRYVLCLV